jgi:periplasmic divalent cation tolerance protein
MFIAWTTVATPAEAERLAGEIVKLRLAACVQIEGPIRSYFIWQGRTESTSEFRLTLKFLPSQSEALEAYIMAKHPYETPEWVVVPVERVAGKYLSWAEANSTPSPL